MDSKKPIIPFPEFHSEVNSVAKTLYESGHFTDALRKASIRLEEVCSKILKDKTGEDLTGVPLMQKLFSYKDSKQKKQSLLNQGEGLNDAEEKDYVEFECVFPLVNLSEKKGPEKQTNFCNLYAGYMGAIRNTIMHTTAPLDNIEALYGLNIVSYLFYKLDSNLSKKEPLKDIKKELTSHNIANATNAESILMSLSLNDSEIKTISQHTKDQSNAKLDIKKRVEGLVVDNLEKIGEEIYNLFFCDKNFQEKIYSSIIKKIYDQN